MTQVCNQCGHTDDQHGDGMEPACYWETCNCPGYEPVSENHVRDVAEMVPAAQAETEHTPLRLQGHATDLIWTMDDGNGNIGLRLDCGDSGVVWLTPQQAQDTIDALRLFVTHAGLKVENQRLRDALKGARTNVAYAHQPDNCGDHCRNNCRDCVLKNTLDDLDAALSGTAVTPSYNTLKASHKALVEALGKVRRDLQLIAERVSTQQSEAAMNCLGISMTQVDEALANAAKLTEATNA